MVLPFVAYTASVLAGLSAGSVGGFVYGASQVLPDIRKRADSIVKSLGIDPKSQAGDAFRHALTSAATAHAGGLNFSKKLGDLNESANRNNNPNDARQDKFNNAYGRWLVEQEIPIEQWTDKIQEALDSGFLITDPDNDKRSFPEDFDPNSFVPELNMNSNNGKDNDRVGFGSEVITIGDQIAALTGGSANKNQENDKSKKDLDRTNNAPNTDLIEEADIDPEALNELLDRIEGGRKSSSNNVNALTIDSDKLIKDVELIEDDADNFLNGNKGGERVFISNDDGISSQLADEHVGKTPEVIKFEDISLTSDYVSGIFSEHDYAIFKQVEIAPNEFVYSLEPITFDERNELLEDI